MVSFGLGVLGFRVSGQSPCLRNMPEISSLPERMASHFESPG